MSADVPRLPASRCRACGTTFVPPVSNCASCGAENVAETDVPGVGTVYAYTDVQIAKTGESYRIGYVDLDPATRVFARFEMRADSAPQLGATAQAVEAVGNGDPTWLWSAA